jgi:hypothetical protein
VTRTWLGITHCAAPRPNALEKHELLHLVVAQPAETARPRLVAELASPAAWTDAYDSNTRDHCDLRALTRALSCRGDLACAPGWMAPQGAAGAGDWRSTPAPPPG